MILVQASKLLTQLVALPFLLLGSIPLAISSILTMSMAFLILSLRILLVYIDFFIAVTQPKMSTASPGDSDSKLLHAGSDGVSHSESETPPPQLPGTKPSTSIRFTSSASAPASRRGSVSQSLSSSMHIFHSSQDRDFEGIGGWRSPDFNTGGDMNDDELTWVSLNKRLELPSPVFYTAATTSSPSNSLSGSSNYRNFHRRTPTTDSLGMLRQMPPQRDTSNLRRNKSVLAFNDHRLQDEHLHTAPIYLGTGAEGYFSFQPKI